MSHKKISGQFLPRKPEMLKSPAMRVLSLAGHRILMRLEVEHASHGGKDNGKLPVTFDQFEEFGIHRHAIGPALREAYALGFVEVTRSGRFGLAMRRIPNLFRLTYLPTSHAFATDGWHKIKTIDEAERIARRARQEKRRRRKKSPKNSLVSKTATKLNGGFRHQGLVAESATKNPDSLVAESATTSRRRSSHLGLNSLSPNRRTRASRR